MLSLFLRDAASRQGKAVADAADGFPAVRLGSQFLAQPLHVRVQRTARGLVAVPPYATEQVVAVQGLAFPFNHMDPELEFRGRQIYFLLVDIEFEGVFVKSEGAVFRNDAARPGASPP